MHSIQKLPKKVSFTFHSFFNDCRIPQNVQFCKEKNILEIEILMIFFLYFALVIVVEK